MGGTGSGNHYHWWRGEKKTVVEECPSLDASRWKREGILQAGVRLMGSWYWTYRSGSRFKVNFDVNTLNQGYPFLQLSYCWVWGATGQQDSATYPVELETTHPHFGGLRWWFLCPLVVRGQACSRRVGKLYLPPSARYFGCRNCHDLTYTSCQESHQYDRLYRHMARDLGWNIATVKSALNGLGKRRSGLI
jgi:hypothetical protein